MRQYSTAFNRPGAASRFSVGLESLSWRIRDPSVRILRLLVVRTSRRPRVRDPRNDHGNLDRSPHRPAESGGGTLGFVSAINDGFESILDLPDPALLGGGAAAVEVKRWSTPAQLLKQTFPDLPAHIGPNVHVKGDTAFVSYDTAVGTR